MNKLFVALGAVAALGLVGGTSLQANALPSADVIAKAVNGAIKRGDGIIAKHLEHAKKGWEELKAKVKAADLKGKAKKAWKKAWGKVRKARTRIQKAGKKVKVKLIEEYKKARDAATAWFEKAAAKVGDAAKGDAK